MKKSLSAFIVSCFLLTSCATQQVLPNPSGSNSTTTNTNFMI